MVWIFSIFRNKMVDGEDDIYIYTDHKLMLTGIIMVIMKYTRNVLACKYPNPSILFFLQFLVGTVFPCALYKERNDFIATASDPTASDMPKTSRNYEKDTWYPTAKNVARHGFDDARWRACTPCCFFYQTPNAKLILHSVC